MNIGCLCFVFYKVNVYMSKRSSLRSSSVVDDFFSVTTFFASTTHAL